MPNYDVFCEKCSIEFEEFNVPVNDKDNIKCYMCDGETVTLITQRGFQYLETFDSDLNAFVTGPGHRSRLMKEKGLEEVHRSEVTRINNSVVKSKEKKGRRMIDAVDRLHSKGKFNPNWSKYVGM